MRSLLQFNNTSLTLCAALHMSLTLSGKNLDYADAVYVGLADGRTAPLWRMDVEEKSAQSLTAVIADPGMIARLEDLHVWQGRFWDENGLPPRMVVVTIMDQSVSLSRKARLFEKHISRS